MPTHVSYENNTDADNLNSTGKFQKVANIEEVYEMGEDLIPMEPVYDRKGNLLPPQRTAQFGVRKSDGLKCVLKVRNKKTGFLSDSEVVEWKTIMHIMYNLSWPTGKATGAGGLNRICLVHDLIEDNTNYYCSMEFCEGRDLFDFHNEERVYRNPNRDKIAAYVFKELLLATNELHSYGLVHRDLKLENVVMVGPPANGEVPEGKIKIIDLDTIEIWKGGNISPNVMGTDQYIGPEVYLGQVTPAGDIWSLAVVFFVIFTGYFPFPDNLFVDQPGENQVGHPSMAMVNANLKRFKIDFRAPPWPTCKPVRDMLRRMFTLDHEGRYTAEMCLRLPFFAEQGV